MSIHFSQSYSYDLIWTDRGEHNTQISLLEFLAFNVFTEETKRIEIENKSWKPNKWIKLFISRRIKMKKNSIINKKRQTARVYDFFLIFFIFATVWYFWLTSPTPIGMQIRKKYFTPSPFSLSMIHGLRLFVLSLNRII